jgi:hypothetical protein
MILSRRHVLKSGVATAIVAGGGMSQIASATPGLLVYDSRIPASAAFALSHAVPAIDIAQEDAALWRNVRGIAQPGAVAGLTGWSDWVVIRGLLEENGLRMATQTQQGRLFRWTMRQPTSIEGDRSIR